ncbi:peptidase S8 [Lewinellaceae bacterium SD302]|nr:peptidase S8 [Lewinellaceae bacterium SD302]
MSLRPLLCYVSFADRRWSLTPMYSISPATLLVKKQLLLRLLLGVVSLSLFSTLFAQGTLHPDLTDAFTRDDKVETLIIFQNQQRFIPADTDALISKVAKGQYVFNELRKLAGEDQRAVSSYLTAAEIEYRSLSIANVIGTTLNESQAKSVAELANVKTLIVNPWIQQDLGFVEREQVQARQIIEWGVQQIGAPQLWDEGFTGQGVTVGGQDTGYDYLHPTLFAKYRGNVAGDTIHDYNWHDAIHSISPLNNNDDNPCGLDVPFPCDDNNHGTHTMGTMVGDDGAGNQIGVAPGASWMACRNMERGWGSPQSYLECFEWFLAPTRVDGSEPDPAQAPHVIANSWSCPLQEGCTDETYELFDVAINNLRAAGVVVVTSAGNDGSECETINKPPSVFPGAYSIGASNDSDEIANFSSRGPSTFNGETYLQPQVVAPGVNVRSAIRDGGYASFNGTSMAGPHVAGAVAVLISALPDLAGNVTAIEEIFRQSAVPLFSDQSCGDFPGDERPNAVYGYGRIDLVEAYALGQEIVSTREILLAADRFEVFPNPASDFVTVVKRHGAPARNYTVTDLNGRVLLGLQSSNAGNDRIELKSLPTGVYLLRIETADGIVVQKVVKQ